MKLMNLNTGKDWSVMDLADLRSAMALGEAIEKIADFLCREVAEVRQKIAEIDPNYEAL